MVQELNERLQQAQDELTQHKEVNAKLEDDLVELQVWSTIFELKLILRPAAIGYCS